MLLIPEMINQIISLYTSKSFVLDLFQIQISHLFSSESVMSNIRISLSHGGVTDVRVRKLKTSMDNLQEFGITQQMGSCS